MTLLTDKTPISVIFDFDGTITDIDVVDGILVQFAADKSWIEYEKAWSNGDISSEDCLREQIKAVQVSNDQLDGYLKSIKIDPGFSMIQNFLKSKNIPLIILSDGFDLFIKKVFEINSLNIVPFQSNHLENKDDQLIPSFPYKSDSCKRCAHCKKETLNAYKHLLGHIVFIGDGNSDICALDAVDTVYAKGKLAKYCDENNIEHFKFENLSQIQEQFKSQIEDIQNRVMETTYEIS